MDALDSLRSVSTAYSNLQSLEADVLLISHQEDDGFKQHSEQLVRVAYCRPNKIRIEQSHGTGRPSSPMVIISIAISVHRSGIQK
jgi:hypothetical protein